MWTHLDLDHPTLRFRKSRRISKVSWSLWLQSREDAGGGVEGLPKPTCAASHADGAINLDHFLHLLLICQCFPEGPALPLSWGVCFLELMGDLRGRSGPHGQKPGQMEPDLLTGNLQGLDTAGRGLPGWEWSSSGPSIWVCAGVKPRPQFWVRVQPGAGIRAPMVTEVRDV